MTKLKICGVTLADDAAAVAAAGADFIGLNFWAKSKRFIELRRAPLIAAAARGSSPSIRIVGVFVDDNPLNVIRIAAEVGLDAIQLHGDESPTDAAHIATQTRRPVWKAIAADQTARITSYPCETILLDTPSAGRGGSGSTFDWAIAREQVRLHPSRLWVLAGGITPDNAAAAIAAVHPWALDVASGSERAPGIKDLARVTALVAAARAV